MDLNEASPVPMHFAECLGLDRFQRGCAPIGFAGHVLAAATGPRNLPWQRCLSLRHTYQPGIGVDFHRQASGDQRRFPRGPERSRGTQPILGSATTDRRSRSNVSGIPGVWPRSTGDPMHMERADTWTCPSQVGHRPCAVAQRTQSGHASGSAPGGENPDPRAQNATRRSPVPGASNPAGPTAGSTRCSRAPALRTYRPGQSNGPLP